MPVTFYRPSTFSVSICTILTLRYQAVFKKEFLRTLTIIMKNKEHCGRRVPISMCGGTLCPSVPNIPTGRNTAPLKGGGTLSPS
jgi:hypothetical protein